MTSFINLMGNTVWSEADIINRGRATIASVVSAERQNELRTIFLGHLAGMRVATADELAEIGLVKALTEKSAAENTQARTDMALLHEVFPLEVASTRLSKKAVLPVTEEQTDPKTKAVTQVVVNKSEVDKDTAERSAAQTVIDAATISATDLFLLRNPPPPKADQPANKP